MAWSSYQNAIFEYATNPNNGSFVISAVAGSGKTTTLVECAKRISGENPFSNILFLAFNKSIVEKLRSEVTSPNMKCATLHSLGLSVLYKSKMKFVMNDSKWKNYINKNLNKLLVGDIPEKKKFIFVKNCIQLLQLCRINLIKPGDDERIKDIAFRFHIGTLANEVEAVSKLLKTANNLFAFKTPKGIEIDYTDMLCWPLLDSFRKYIFKYNVVFIDEAQDLSLAQQTLMLECVAKDGKFIASGDKNQSITGFAGTMVDSFDALYKKAGKQLPLSVNYRCGKTIIERAQTIVPEIEAYEDAVEGEIIHQENLAGVEIGDMVICRKTNPLIDIALKMMRKGISCYVKGADIAEKLKTMVQSTYDSDDSGLSKEQMFAKLDAIRNKLYVDLKDRGISNPYSHPVYINTCDNIEAIKTVSEYCLGVGDVIELLDKIFDDTVRGDAIMLSTVHKAKGLEADNVYIVCPELLPMTFENQQDWELKQEMNLKYVAITRAKKKLVFVDVPEKQIECLLI